MTTTALPEGAISYTTKDKRERWGEGPWADEPDKVQWVDPATDLDCLLHRNHMGAWCGYVGVPPTHPYYRVGYDNVPVSAHGGLTYADLCQEGGDEAHGICHVPLPGREPHVWWLGFDCMHAGDLSPLMAKHSETDANVLMLRRVLGDEHYWTVAEAIDEVRDLAAQLAALR